MSACLKGPMQLIRRSAKLISLFANAVKFAVVRGASRYRMALGVVLRVGFR